MIYAHRAQNVSVLGAQSRPGFTIAELMIYITIVGLLLAALIGGFTGFLERGRRSSTSQALQTVKGAISTFHADYGKYPSKLEDLVEKPKTELGKKWYALLEKLPKDGWSNEFYYRVNPAGSKRPYELYSTGGSSEGDEDPDKQISVWDL